MKTKRAVSAVHCRCGFSYDSNKFIGCPSVHSDAFNQAKAQIESITEMVNALLDGEQQTATTGKHDIFEEAEQRIREDALSVLVRSDWHTPGCDDVPASDEYELLICTGGPAVRLTGKLNQHTEPESARLEYQDWGTPWTDYRLTSEEEETVLTYARCFYYGE